MKKERLKLVVENDNTFLEGELIDMNDMLFDKVLFVDVIKDFLKIVKNKMAIGEYIDDNTEITFDINLHNSSHVIEYLNIDEETSKVYGKFRLMDTLMGNLVKGYALDNIPLYSLIRGSGYSNTGEMTKFLTKIFAIDICTEEYFNSPYRKIDTDEKNNKGTI